MEMKIGITRGGPVLEVELADNADRAELRSRIEAVLSGTDQSVFWVTDKKGKELAIASSTIAFIQLGSEDSRSIGFGA